ncbi:MAG: nitrate ABC transporter ATP-binding protein [Alphaproteobacteria bacterium]|nr:nitrate ABC transporter ATP-binding protein [Alphaproteobacteria bacterium]
MELVVEGVSKTYDDLLVLNQIDLTADEGQIVCIIGPSGCGKSTLLRLMGGLEEPSSGNIKTRGLPPSDCLNALTFIFQDFSLLPWRTVESNISLVLEDHPISNKEKQEIINSVLQRTNLSEFSKRWPRELSGGMKQRVGIARALAVNPSILLMDEPLSALDSQTSEILLNDLIDLWDKQRFTSIYITHNLSEAIRIGHKIVVMSRRPGEVRETVNIEKALKERELRNIELEKYLWNLLKEEAVAAEREIGSET